MASVLLAAGSKLRALQTCLYVRRKLIVKFALLLSSCGSRDIAEISDVHLSTRYRLTRALFLSLLIFSQIPIANGSAVEADRVTADISNIERSPADRVDAGSSSASEVSPSEDRGYRLPPKAIVDLIDIPPPPNVRVSPNGQWLALEDKKSLPNINEIDTSVLRLAGISVNPSNGNPPIDPSNVRVLTNRSLGLIRVSDGAQFVIRNTPNERMSGVLWAPDGLYLAFLHYTQNGPELWVASTERQESWRLSGPMINEAGPPIGVQIVGGFGACQWMPDSRHLLCLTEPLERGAPPTPPPMSMGPVIEDTRHSSVGTSSFDTDLLHNDHDEALFHYYATSQPQLIDISTSHRENIGEPAVYLNLRPSPNGKYFLSERAVVPYSRRVPYWYFARTVDIIDERGAPLHHVGRFPEGFKAVTNERNMNPGPRAFTWRPNAMASLCFAELLDGDFGHPARYRDRLMELDFPFNRPAHEVLRTQGIIQVDRQSVGSWTTDGRALVKEKDLRNNIERMWLLQEKSKALQTELWERKIQGFYGDSVVEKFVLTYDSRGQRTLLHQGEWVYLEGTEYKDPKDGTRMFVDRLNLLSHRRERLFRSSGESYERFIAVLDGKAGNILTTFETPQQPPDYLLRNLRIGTQRYLTAFRETGQYYSSGGQRGIELTYTRADGLPLNGTLLLPKNYERGVPVPTIVWSYPLIVESIDAYKSLPTRAAVSAATISPYTFTGFSTEVGRYSSDDLVRTLITQGYAIFYIDMPLVGGAKAYETYVDQIVANANAAVDVLLKRGITRHGIIGVGGHSFGGTIAVSLLAHTDLFAAGVSIDGMYDPTRTPFALVMETRNYWEAPLVYRQISAWESANRVNSPLLLIHGQADDNWLTRPADAQFIYDSLKGLRKTVRLVMLPAEGHDPRAPESVLEMIAEMVSWFDTYIKSPVDDAPRSRPASAPDPTPR